MNRRYARTAFLVAALACGCLLVGTGAWAQDTSAILMKMVVKVPDRDRAADAVVAAAEAAQGYFTEKSRDVVIVKVPAAQAQGLIEIVTRQGEVIDRQYRREDLGDELIKKQAALKSKEAVHNQYLEVLRQADAEDVLYVEKEIVELVGEIETLKGAIRYLHHRVRFAEIQVSFQFRDRAAPVADGTSSFAWLNTLNLMDLLKDY
jgi:hypothetical protein